MNASRCLLLHVVVFGNLSEIVARGAIVDISLNYCLLQFFSSLGGATVFISSYLSYVGYNTNAVL